ncbi:hypothetical protein B0H16DRAFT_1752808 [Mycena metata]|uniref:Uncharacterized protein n=1 Tax=Mycena metata TaxID=1033252 RepID=A0AAD7DEZ5_9AGAR|nr:hypothetical protein B0H16DRAFT_1752808 [Mycena metata]
MPHPGDSDTEDPPITLLSFGESSTTIRYGLPPAHQQRLLADYRARFFKDQTRLIRARNLLRPRRERPMPNMELYDHCCEYYREVYTMQTASSTALYAEAEARAGSDIDSDSDSVVSSMPSLEVSGPSSPAPWPAVDPQALDAATDLATDTADTQAAADVPVIEETPNEKESLQQGELQQGERYQNVDFPIFIPNGYVPIAELTENLSIDPAEQFTAFTDGEGIERVWSLLNQVNRPDYTIMGPGRRQDMLKDYDPPRHRLKIHTRTGIRNVYCRCTNGKHSAFERRQLYAFPDGEGNIVIKKSKNLLLPL